MPIVWAQYNANKKFIASKICVNRFKPVLKCDGKCFLAKQLAKANESEQSQNDNGTVKSLSVDYCEELQRYFFAKLPTQTREYIIYNSAKFLPGFSKSIFHPPLV